MTGSEQTQGQTVEEERLAKLLDFATRGARGRQLVFFCSGPA